jgi:hypothetical protein
VLNIPIYMKETQDFVRLSEEEYYLIAQNGVFLCRNHRFFQSDVRIWGDKSHFSTYSSYSSSGGNRSQIGFTTTSDDYYEKWRKEDEAKARKIAQLQPHEESAISKFPPIPADLLQLAVGFFDSVHSKHQTEAIVLLFWNLKEKRYQLFCPPQKVSWGSCKYQMAAPPPMSLQVGSIHSHGTMSAYSSWDDKQDERYLDGIHVVVGYIDREPPDLHTVLAVDGHHFDQEPGKVLEAYTQRNPLFPQEWLNQLELQRFESVWSWGSGYTGYYGTGRKRKKKRKTPTDSLTLPHEPSQKEPDDEEEDDPSQSYLFEG